MYHFVCQVQGKVGSKDSKSFKTEQQWCDTCCCRYALCPNVCKYIAINRTHKSEFKMLLFMCFYVLLLFLCSQCTTIMILGRSS